MGLERRMIEWNYTLFFREPEIGGKTLPKIRGFFKINCQHFVNFTNLDTHYKPTGCLIRLLHQVTAGLFL